MTEERPVERPPSHADGEPLLSVAALRRYYPVRSGILNRKVGDVRAVDGVSFDLRAGETLAVVGESGCGKTTLAETVLGLERPTGGEVSFRGRSLGDLSRRQRRRLRREMGAVFQDPASSLNDRMTVGRIVREPFEVHGVEGGDERVGALLERVGLDPGTYRDRYPHELSGGQQQRVAIARAVALEPALVVLDEPVSALDVSIQASILSLLADLQATDDIAYLFVSHDLSVVRHVADRVAVMYAGQFVETADAEALFADPRHPYTEALIADVPRLDADGVEGIGLAGAPPDPAEPPTGCRFHPRCHLREALDDREARRCVDDEPTLDAGVACHFRPEDAAE